MPLLKRADPEPEETWAGPVWEYKTVNLNWKASVGIEPEFNKLGRQGWEFVAMVERGNVHRAIFKRRTP